eukprot:gene40096-39412_t
MLLRHCAATAQSAYLRCHVGMTVVNVNGRAVHTPAAVAEAMNGADRATLHLRP